MNGMGSGNSSPHVRTQNHGKLTPSPAKILLNQASYQILAKCRSTTIFSKHITSALTAIKDRVIKYSETVTVFSNSNVNYFWSIKTLPWSSKSYDCLSFNVLKFLLSTFPLYTPLLVIRSVSDVLRAQSRFVKFVGGEAAGRTPYIFYKPTLGLTYFGPTVGL